MVFADSIPDRRTVRKQLKLSGRNLRYPGTNSKI